MGNCIITNNATGELAAGINDSVTSIVLKSGEGALFPNPTGDEYFYVTISDDAGNLEICKVTARSTNTLTVERGADNTTAAAWDTDDTVSLRFNAAQYENFFQLDSDNTVVGDITQTGDLSVTGALTLTGGQTISGLLETNGTLQADGVVDINNNTTLDGTFDVTGATTITGACDVVGDTTVLGTFDVIGDSSVLGAFDVVGAATVSTTLGVTGAATFASTLETSGDITVNSTVALNSVSGREYHVFTRGDVLRWSLGHTMGTESGSNVESDLELVCYADDGATPVATAMTITRATGLTTFNVMPEIGGVPVGFAAGTKMMFYQASAPTGWTAESINDKAIRVVSAGGTGGQAGGTTAFSSVLTNRTLSGDQMPEHYHLAGDLIMDTQGAHAHSYTKAVSGSAPGGQGVSDPISLTSANTSSNGDHTHNISGQTGTAGSGNPIDFAIQYCDVIIATKD